MDLFEWCRPDKPLGTTQSALVAAFSLAALAAVRDEGDPNISGKTTYTILWWNLVCCLYKAP